MMQQRTKSPDGANARSGVRFPLPGLAKKISNHESHELTRIKDKMVTQKSYRQAVGWIRVIRGFDNS
jgi:hypothetical protein